MTPRVGLAGLGRMGRAAGQRVLAAGYPLTVWNRTPGRADELLALGAKQVHSPDCLATQADVVLTMLSDDRAVHEVYDGLLAGAGAPLYVEMSTVRTDTIVRLAPRVVAAGARLVDAPMSGPPAAVRAGALLVLAGGEAGDVTDAREVLGSFARRVVHLGPTGAGTTMKLVLQLPMAVMFASLGEALSIGTQFGLPVEDMLEVILDSQGAPPVLHGRAEVIRRACAGLVDDADAGVGFDVAGVRKDLQAMVATALDVGVPASTAAAALGVFAAATASGYGHRDLASVVDYAVRLAAVVQPRDAAAAAAPLPRTVLTR